MYKIYYQNKKIDRKISIVPVPSHPDTARENTIFFPVGYAPWPQNAFVG